MATHTDYFNLEKPESYENYNIAVFNNNADTIDLQMHNNQVSAAKVMVGATSLADGESGRVPTPHAGDEDKYLKGDGTWAAGNSNVEANPSGTPTETLESIGINGDIYQLPEGGDTEITGDAEGSVISINDGKLNTPLKACTVDINPVQSGSGTPSPSNIRPISGWDSEEITVAGKNLLNNNADNLEIGGIVGNTGANTSSIYRVRNTIAYFFPLDDLIDSGYVWTIPSGYKMAIRCYDKDGNYITENSRYSGFISEIPPGLYGTGVEYVRFIFAKTDDTAITVNEISNLGFQIEYGTIATTYEPYNGTTYNIEFEDSGSPLTVYGGTFDTVSGVLTVTDGYIASYDGETLPSTWISDRDVYAAGTTPTTGAEVVYKLATPTEISLTPTEITTLYGNNVIWADSGDMAIKYVRDTSIAINDALNQSITPTYSSGTKIADYNIGGHTGAIYVQGAGGQMDTLWTGSETPTMSYNPTITLAHPISDYDFLLVNFNNYNGNFYLKSTVTLYGLTAGDYVAQEILPAAGAAMFANVINDYNITLNCYGGSYEHTTYVSIIGVKL